MGKFADNWNKFKPNVSYPLPSPACPFPLAVHPGQPKHAPHNLE